MVQNVASMIRKALFLSILVASMAASSVSRVVREVFSTPFLSGARFMDIQRNEEATTMQIQIDHIIRSFPSDPPSAKSNVKPRKYLNSQITTCILHSEKLSGLSSGPNQLNDIASFRHTSPSFEWTVTGLMRSDDGNGSPKPTLQIWHRSHFLGEFEMSEAHGEFCTDDFFGWVTWDESKGHFIYQAEAKAPEIKDYNWAPSFGETMPKRKNPTVFVVDLKENAKVLASLPPSNVQPSQLIRTEEPDTVYFIGVKKIPGKKYGLAYCPNRPTNLYRWDYAKGGDPQMVDMDQAGAEALHHPVYNPATQSIMMTATYKGGSHDHAMNIYAYSLADLTFSKILDGEVDVIETVNGQRVRGLFPSFAQMPSALSSGHLPLMSFNGTDQSLLVIGPDGSVRLIPSPTGSFQGQSWNLFQVRGDFILASISDRATLPKVYLGKWDGTGFAWNLVAELKTESGIAQELYHVSDTVDIMMTKPVDAKASETPLIIFPHGGPNCSYNTIWSLYGMTAGRLGYAIAAINYTGSAGYGQKAIRALEGRVGELDVEDCLTATKYLVETVGFSRDRLYLFGGSHGGFLVTHLSTHHFRFPWRAVVAHNPVIDLSTMVMTSDIADFAFGQMGLPFDLEHFRPPTSEEAEAMKKASPSSRVHLVKAPTLLVIGEEDLRVPPSQGKAWYSWLKALGVETDILTFTSGHACNSPEAEYVEFNSMFSWFNAH